MIAGWTQQNTPRTINTSDLISTLLLILDFRQCQLYPSRRGRVGHYPERVTESMSCEGEVMHAPEVNGGKFGQNPEGGTVRVPKYHNIEEPPGSSQVQSPVKIQLDHQLYQSKRSIAKG